MVIVIIFIFSAGIGSTLLLDLGDKIHGDLETYYPDVPWSTCPNDDLGDVPVDVFESNIKKASRIAWTSHEPCWIKMRAVDKDGNPVDLSYQEIHDNITQGMDVITDREDDDCIKTNFSHVSDPKNSGTSSIDHVFWWDDETSCSAGDAFTWAYGALPFKHNTYDTLFMFSREDYCRHSDQLEWFDPMRGSNVYEFSRLKGRVNDHKICNGEDLSLPVYEDLKDESDGLALDMIIDETSDCINKYSSRHIYDKDIEGYFVCDQTFVIKPESNISLSEIIDGDLEEFSFTHNQCDMLDENGNPNIEEFNPATWSRDSESESCVYSTMDRGIITEPDYYKDMLVEEEIYHITFFYYYDDKEGTSISPGPNQRKDDIIMSIETI